MRSALFKGWAGIPLQLMRRRFPYGHGSWFGAVNMCLRSADMSVGKEAAKTPATTTATAQKRVEQQTMIGRVVALMNSRFLKLGYMFRCFDEKLV
mmetsp:Transcript_2174/g.5133  ORF Transcript_2174/g.5133 Transcript_2174/m.5133 type:complete len:95 (+) Transcript_2174:3623-3907(+)